VLWTNSNETSIVPTGAVGDKRLLTDPQRIGKVKWMPLTKKKEPKEGWSSHDARVLHLSG